MRLKIKVKKNNKKTLIKNIIFLLIVQLINYLSPIIILPYLSRTLSMDNFGFMMLIIASLAIINIITDFGFNITATNIIARKKENKKFISKYISKIFTIKLGIFIIASIFILTSIIIQQKIDIQLDIAFLFIAIIFFQTFQTIWFFQGIEKMQSITIVMAISKSIYVISIFALVKHENDLFMIMICLLLSNFFIFSFCIISIYYFGYRLSIVKLNQIKTTFIYNISFFISRAAASIYTTANTLIVGMCGGLQQSAIYSSAEKLYQAGQAISSPIQQALYPYLSREKDERTLFFVVFLTAIPLTICSLIAAYYSSDIIIIFYGSEYIEASTTLKVFLFCIIISYININFGYPAFSIINRLDIANKTVIFGALFQIMSLTILLSFSLVTPINITICTLLTEFLVMSLRLYFYITICKKSKREKSTYDI